MNKTSIKGTLWYFGEYNLARCFTDLITEEEKQKYQHISDKIHNYETII